MSKTKDKVQPMNQVQDLKQQSNKPQKEILTVEETMELLSISRNTFDRFKKQGILKVYRLNRRLYCKYSEVIEAIENGLQHAA